MLCLFLALWRYTSVGLPDHQGVVTIVDGAIAGTIGGCEEELVVHWRINFTAYLCLGMRQGFRYGKVLEGYPTWSAKVPLTWSVKDLMTPMWEAVTDEGSPMEIHRLAWTHQRGTDSDGSNDH